MNNIMDVHKLSINLDINRYIEYTLMYIGYECVGYVFIYTSLQEIHSLPTKITDGLNSVGNY